MVLRGTTRIVRVFKYATNGARDLVSKPFTSTIYGVTSIRTCSPNEEEVLHGDRYHGFELVC